MNLRNTKNSKCGLYIAVVSTRAFGNVYWYFWLLPVGVCVCECDVSRGRGLGCCWPAGRAQDSPRKLPRNPAPSAVLGVTSGLGSGRESSLLPSISSRALSLPPPPVPLWVATTATFLFSNFCCCCSVTQSCPTLCDPMDCSTPGFPVLHHLPECSNSSIKSVMPSNYLILCHPLFLLPSIFPSIREQIKHQMRQFF